MPSDILAVADRLWNGDLSTTTFHPVDHIGGFVEITDGVGFCPSFANVSSFATEDGLLLVDTGSAPLAQIVHDDIRSWSPARLNTAVYSHGHIDHVFGVPVWEAEAAAHRRRRVLPVLRQRLLVRHRGRPAAGRHRQRPAGPDRPR